MVPLVGLEPTHLSVLDFESDLGYLTHCFINGFFYVSVHCVRNCVSFQVSFSTNTNVLFRISMYVNKSTAAGAKCIEPVNSL